MTIAKLRNFSALGVITDVDPYNLPAQAWSNASNTRFENNSIVRAPVFRRIPITLAEADPRYLFSNLSNTGFDTLYIGYKNGKVSSVDSGVEADVSIAGFVTNDSDERYTSCHLADVLYVNRNDRVPWSKDNNDTDFVALAGGWDSGWRAKLLRACSGALVALGMTEAGVSYPTKIRTSEFALVNDIPADWDATSTTSNATSNILAEMEGPIVDACNLGAALIIYGLNEAWEMQADGSEDVFRYRKLPFSTGSISANCSVEVEGKNYVFGPNDIWVHDGVSQRSICDGRVRKFIYRSIDISQARRCMVTHDPLRKELRFSFVSGDSLASFAPNDGCNRCAVYDYVRDIWHGFDDLPYVYGFTSANIDQTLTWTTVTQTWETIGATWLDQEDSIKRPLIMLGDVSATYGFSLSLYAVDQQGPNSIVSYPVDTTATMGVTIQKDGLDLDELPEVEDNRGYKVLSSIYPQARFEDDAEPLMFSFGAANNYNNTVTFSDEQSYDGDTYTKCDFFSGGRYLFMHITHDDYHYFNFTGIDAEIDVTGQY